MPRSLWRHNLADVVFDALDVLVGEFDARAGWRLDVDHELAGIGARKERHAEKGIEPEAEDEHAEDGEHSGRRTQQCFADGDVVVHEHLVVLAIEPGDEPRKWMSFVPWWATEPWPLMNRAQNSGTTVIATMYEANSDRHNRRRQRHEQKSADTVEEHDREKDDGGGEGRGQYRQRDFLSAALGCNFWVLAFFEMAEDVLQHHHGVVDQSGERQRQSAQHHGVDRASTGIDREKCRQRRQRNRQQHGEGGPKAAEENQDHQRRQDQPDAAFVAQVLDRCLHEHRLVEHHARYQRLRHIEQVFQRCAYSVDNRNGVAVAALLQDREVHRALAIDAHDVGLDGTGIFGIADVGHHHLTVAFDLQRQTVDLLRRRQLAVGVDVVVLRADAHIASGKDGVRLVHCAHYVHQAQLVSFQLHRIDVHLDLAILPAERLRHRCARHIRNLVAHGELPDVVQLGFVQSLALQRDQTYRQARRIELQHHRRQGAGRQATKLRHGQVGNRADRGVGIRARLEVHTNQAHAGERARFDVIDPAAEREKALEGIGDVRFDLFRRHAVVERRHHHDRNVDVGKQIDRHADERGHADHGDDQAHHDDEEGVADRETRHQFVPPCAASELKVVTFGSTTCPGWNEPKLPTITRSPSLSPDSTSTRLGSSSPVWISRGCTRFC